ncbi:multi-sensor hybrid histidine kinase [Stylonychia lemnae]|uniref:histidine kinase n=1 Tax=Stylonychia lemnae TaxID=5949 RepID=A0A078AXM1_STYLE|nr:multi-sensor hybrid histidine kinase [Stylonychia lemnae]|eukprot:CDW85553.1 multi-sensor hybrid histidine kinase [Stylonychia lemnae]
MTFPEVDSRKTSDKERIESLLELNLNNSRSQNFEMTGSNQKLETNYLKSLELYRKSQEVSRTFGPSNANQEINEYPDKTPIKQSQTQQHSNPSIGKNIKALGLKTLQSNQNVRPDYKQKIQKLETTLQNTRIFLSMVIHDMRNPTNSIDFALKEVLNLLDLNKQSGPNNRSNFKGSMSFGEKHAMLRESTKINTNSYNKKFTQSSNPFGSFGPFSSIKCGNNLPSFDQQLQQQQSRNQSNPFSKLLTKELNVIQEEQKGEDSVSFKVSKNQNFKFGESPPHTLDDIDMPDELISERKTSINQIKEMEINESSSIFLDKQNFRRFVQLSDLPGISLSIIQHDAQQSQRPMIQFELEHETIGHPNLQSNRYSSRQLFNRDQPRNDISFGHCQITEAFMIENQNGHQPQYYNSGQNSPTNELAQEVLMHFKEKGILMNDYKRSYAEQLLKNSLFGSTMLLNLINDLLDLAKMQNSKDDKSKGDPRIILNPVWFNIFETVQKAIDTIEFQAQQKNIQIFNEFDEEVLGYFVQVWDKQKIQKSKEYAALENIKNNKPKDMEVKTQRSRSVSLNNNDINKLQTIDMENNQYYIDFKIQIKDSGCGISKENINKIFVNFGKLDEHKKINQGGTGLGLSICKSLIELMGGSVKVESEKDVGTTFMMSLKTKQRMKNFKSFNPYAEECSQHIPKQNFHFQNQSQLLVPPGVEEQTSERAQSKYSEYQALTPIAYSNGLHMNNTIERHKKYSVLIANDEVFQLMIMMRILQQSDFIVDDAENGMGGIEACKKIRFNGFQGIQDIFNVKAHNDQSDDFLQQPPVMIALSAFADESIQNSCIEAGFDDFIETPLTSDKIREKIIKKLEDREQEKNYLQMIDESPIGRVISIAPPGCQMMS